MPFTFMKIMDVCAYLDIAMTIVVVSYYESTSVLNSIHFSVMIMGNACMDSHVKPVYETIYFPSWYR